MGHSAQEGHVRPGRFVDYFGARLFVPAGHFDEAHMLAGGRPEHHVLSAFSRLVRPGDVVVDVGANIGTHTFALATLVGPGGRVYAVEADIDNAASLRVSVLESGASNVRLLPVAASDAPGLIGALSSVATNTTFSGAACDGGAKVAVAVMLDAVISEPVALIKLDIEGAELLALRGLARTVDRSRPLVMSEFSPAYIEANLGRDRSDEFFAFFADRDYRCFFLNPFTGPEPVADYHELLAVQRDSVQRLSWNHIDVLFAPRESAAAVRASA